MKTTEQALTIFERVSIQSSLPKATSYEKAIIYKDLVDKLQLSQAEVVATGFASRSIEGTDQVSMVWDVSKDPHKVVKLTELEVDLIKKAFEQMNKQERLPIEPRWIKLYERFAKSTFEFVEST